MLPLACIIREHGIGAVRNYVTTDCCEKLLHSFVHQSWAIVIPLVSLPKRDIAKLQKVKNVVACIVMRDNTLDNVTPLLLSLHWLPIPLRTFYKPMLPPYKCLNGEGPVYRKDLLLLYTPKDCLRSANQELLQPKRFKLVAFCKRAFYHAGPSYWNTISYKVVRRRKLMLSKKL